MRETSFFETELPGKPGGERVGLSRDQRFDRRRYAVDSRSGHAANVRLRRYRWQLIIAHEAQMRPRRRHGADQRVFGLHCLSIESANLMYAIESSWTSTPRCVTTPAE